MELARCNALPGCPYGEILSGMTPLAAHPDGPLQVIEVFADCDHRLMVAASVPLTGKFRREGRCLLVAGTTCPACADPDGYR